MIHYFMIWGENPLGRKLAYSPAGLKKAKYVFDVLSRIDKTRVASFACGGEKWNGFYRRKYTLTENNQEIFYCSTFGSSNKHLRKLEHWYNTLQMIIYLLRIPKHDIAVFYHERYFRHAMRFCRLLRRTPKYVLQVEEVYTFAGNYSQKRIDNELASFKNADAYILVNDIISLVLHLDSSKPSCVSYGPYRVQAPSCEQTPADNKIHVVYAGIIDRIKRGAEMTVKASMFLPANYCVHIAGFGNDDDIAYLLSLIEDARKESKCEITFEGCLSGKDYDELMNRCSIGLSTQVSGEFKYSDTSFPSKVINYLSYGMAVVSTRIKVLEKSRVADLLSFYDNDSPNLIAEAILKCPIIDKEVAKDRIHELDNQFEANLRNVLRCLQR